MIFISYRVSDSLDVVSRLDVDLSREFGERAVFRDRTRIRGGQQWKEELLVNARNRRVMLVIIGPNWQTGVGDDGRPRLYEPEDWVRQELVTALEAGNFVIPVLVNNRPMPAVDWLMVCGLEKLADRQALRLRSDDYEHDLARIVAALRELCPQLADQSLSQTEQRWTPAVLCPLQPAPHFSGREGLLADLTSWATAATHNTRVIALVAPGGTGKTALAERVVSAISGNTAAGLFVWSFYTDPQTESFLRAACEYILSKPSTESGALLARLQQGLMGDAAHLFVLDGLELIQADGSTGRPRGEFENEPQMKIFLRWLSAGYGTRARALITSRFSLPSLCDWQGRGYREELLDDLDTEAARTVLRKRGVQGSDSVLDSLVKSVNGHALTIDVLGLYLARYCGGDPSKSPSFDPSALGRDVKVSRLSKVLSSYAEKLPAAERDLLARLSLFPRGVTIEYLEILATVQDKEVAGALAGWNRTPLLSILHELCELGLVFRSNGSDGATYSAHPFLREFFRKLLGAARPEQIHEAVRSKVAATLDDRPGKLPTEPAELDRYERLIEVTRMAGLEKEALSLYASALGGYEHLAEQLGDSSRGLRILASFAPDGTLATASSLVPIGDWASFAIDLGDLVPARYLLERRRLFEHGRRRRSVLWNERGLDSAFDGEVEVHIHAGAWKTASCLAFPFSGVGDTQSGPSHSLKSILHEIIGDRHGANQWRESAQYQCDTYDVSFLGNFPQQVLEADLRLAKYERDLVRRAMTDAARMCRDRRWARSEAILSTILGRCALPDDPARAQMELKVARAYAARSGSMEVTLRCFHLAAELARHEGRVRVSIDEATEGIQLADSCGFGRWSIDIRIELAKARLSAQEPLSALEPANWALQRSLESDCQYAWGAADALHLLGVAYSRLGEQDAVDYLRSAREQRQRLDHPGLGETEDELRRIGVIDSQM